MLVGRSTFSEVLASLAPVPHLALDTETFGLRPYHGDRLFSIILGDGRDSYYMNFQPYPEAGEEYLLLPSHLKQLAEFCKEPRTWILHNAKFDLAFLANEGIELAGIIHCTRAIARVQYNEHLKYSLEACGERIGVKKDATVEQYIKEKKLHEKRKAANTEYTHKFYSRVPWGIITKYGEQDAAVTHALWRKQSEEIESISGDTPGGLPSLRSVLENEQRLTRTLYRMEHTGVRIDRAYCVRAAQYELERSNQAAQAFAAATGKQFVDSGKLFQEVFAGDKDKWGWTEPTPTFPQGQPSFKSDFLEQFSNPAAAIVLQHRDAKSKHDFYQGFLYHADHNDRVHPTFHQGGTGTGRLSSSEPNFQNLSNPEEGEEIPEFTVRGAIVPSLGNVLFSLDYTAMEFWLLADYANEQSLISRVKAGEDLHEATAQMMGVTRKQAKTLNFGLLYGMGVDKLARSLKLERAEAVDLKARYFAALPKTERFIKQVIQTAKNRGYVFNWLGRRSYFPDPNFAYTAPNYIIQGSGADITKVAMNRIDDLLLGRQSKLIMTVHDELVIDTHPSEVGLIDEIRAIMESSYVPRNGLQMKASVSSSERSLAHV